MVRKHEDEFLNFFLNGMTLAKAERLNGKIQRFVSSNYGIKNKFFSFIVLLDILIAPQTFF